MLPLPTVRALIAFAGCAAVLLVGLAGNSGVVIVLSTGGFLSLGLALSLTSLVSQRMKRQGIELSWWHGHGSLALGASAVVGGTYEICCELRNRGDRGLWLEHLRPVTPDGTSVLPPDRPSVFLAPASRTRIIFRMRSDAVGRVVLQGLSVAAPGPLSLFAAALYFPSPLAVQVLPRAARRPVHAMDLSVGQPVERPGQTSVRQRGDGSELRELRELQPGDAFKSIAWKASARRGKLLVREMEREVQETLYLIIDVSGTMRGGVPGQRRLDQAIELAAYAARASLERGDRVGLITVDGRILDHVPPGEGLGHMLRLYDALLCATEVVDADLTEATDDEVAELVRTYLRHQDGLGAERPGGAELDAVLTFVERAVANDPRAGKVVASDPEHARLRRFCQLRGIPLPYRSDTRGFGKGRGLERALLTAAGKTRVPRTILVFSDLDALDPSPALGKALALLRARAHTPIFVCPRDHDAPPANADRTARALHAALSVHEERRHRSVRGALLRAGVPLVAATPDARPAQVIRRALQGPGAMPSMTRAPSSLRGA